MKNKQLMFFAVFEDMEKVIRKVESLIDVYYYSAGMLDSADVPGYQSLFDAPNIDVASAGDWNRIDHYLMMKRSARLNIREVPQRAGGTRYAVDQMINPQSIEVKLGGVYPVAKNTIVAGRIGTISLEADSLALYKMFTTAIKNEFQRIGVFYVGDSAAEKLKMGWRLVTNDRMPREYDLASEA